MAAFWKYIPPNHNPIQSLSSVSSEMTHTGTRTRAHARTRAHTHMSSEFNYAAYIITFLKEKLQASAHSRLQRRAGLNLSELTPFLKRV